MKVSASITQPKSIPKELSLAEIKEEIGVYKATTATSNNRVVVLVPNRVVLYVANSGVIEPLNDPVWTGYKFIKTDDVFTLTVGKE